MVTDLTNWRPWLRRNGMTARFLSGAKRGDPEGYFIRVHAVTENILRRVLLVGLRRNHVMYSDAMAWLQNNDFTPDRVNYPKVFNKLYGPRLTFNQVTGAAPMNDLWELWLDFSKIVRNHISHGIRKYDESWLQCAIHIDQAFIIQLCAVLQPHVGGSLGQDLRKLQPRLSLGKVGVSIPTLLGTKGKNPRPVASLQTASRKFAALGL